MDYFSFGLSIIVIIGAVFALCKHLLMVKDAIVKVNDKLESFHKDDKKSTGTILLPVTRMDPKAECNTVLPLPIGAEMCAHTMDAITNQVIRAPHEERAIIILQCTKCGAIDKTIAVTSPAPKELPPRNECRHEWVKEKTITLPSAFEQMEDVIKETNKKANAAYTNTKESNRKKEDEKKSFDFSNAPAWMFKKTALKERICKNCGQVDRIVVSNFEIENEGKEEDDKRMDEE